MEDFHTTDAAVDGTTSEARWEKNMTRDESVGTPGLRRVGREALQTALSGLLLVCSLFGASQAQGQAQTPTQTALVFDLITADEAQQELKARSAMEPPPRTRSFRADSVSPAATSIRVITPSVQGALVAAPLRIELSFAAAPGARIVPTTFRVLYGVLKIDLTERLRKFATVTESGALVERAQVPEGQHRLIMQVADDQGHTAEQELRIRVGAAL